MKTVYLKAKRKITKRRIIKITKKLCKMNKKEEVVVVIPKYLEDNEELIENLNNHKIQILNRQMVI